jgi:hypothetical protein
MRAESWARNVLLPALTFVLGVLGTALIEGYLRHHDLLLLVLIVLSCMLASLTLMSTFANTKADRAFANLEAQLNRLVSTNGLHVTYIEDGRDGESYRRSTDLILGATESLTFVDMWEPFEGYQTENEALTRVRASFYSAIIAQVQAHRQSQATFHRRIIQVPDKYLRTRVPFEADPMFRNYLLKVSDEQRRYPRVCRLKIAPVQIRFHFIIVDRRHIIIPVLSNDPETRAQTRHGALFFDDRSGDLYRSLVAIYQAVDAHSRPVEARDLVISDSDLEAVAGDVA